MIEKYLQGQITADELHDLFEQEVNEQIKEHMENLKHLKGYMFDSLVYRFKDYQNRAFQSEVNEYKYKRNAAEIEARNIIRDRHDRDLMRFIQILDEAIGEHD